MLQLLAAADLNWNNWCSVLRWSLRSEYALKCRYATKVVRLCARGWRSERTCAQAPLLCMNESQQSANIRWFHPSPWRFNWIQIRSDSLSRSSVGFAFGVARYSYFLLGWRPHGELCRHHAAWSPSTSLYIYIKRPKTITGVFKVVDLCASVCLFLILTACVLAINERKRFF